MATIVHQVVSNDPRPPRRVNSTIPRNLETICLKAMEKNANRRYSSAQKMAADLHRFLKDEPIVGRRSSMLARSWRRLIR
jgi:eukaryotic-like serine/threonine-protein kinase